MALTLTNQTPRAQRRSSHTFSATDEFWFTPTMKDVMPSSYEHDGNAAAPTTIGAMPPAHNQILAAAEHASSEALKGYDHTREAIGYDSLDRAGDEFAWCRQKLSAVKRQGGGSWLLGSLSRPAAEAETKTAAAGGEDLRALPSLVRVPSGSSLESDEDASTTSSDTPSRARGVSFNPAVTVQPIPHSSDLSSFQRHRMYTSSIEVRQNKLRNKKEFCYEGYNWRAATEEWQMGVDMVTAELIHPAHEHGI